MSEIFDLLSKIDIGDKNYYKNLPPNEQKKIYFFLIQRWLTGTTDKNQILMINSFSNTKVFSLYKHPELEYKLLCASTTGNKKRYKWIARKKKETQTESIKIIKQYHDCSTNDAIEYSKIYDKSDIIEMANALGIDKDIIKKIK